ncbi:MAG TPA: cyclic nucleotide-binding domain-containing protein [Rhodospirillales bacterium]|nr:cyclic nucleotide-binding domain-containing protein [Rhodospirillales bacterium]
MMTEQSLMNGAKCITRKFFRKGEEIFDEGEKGYNAYVVISGSVEIFSSPDGVKVILGEVCENGLFGEMPLIDGAPRMASAAAKADTNCMVIPYHAFREKMESNDPFTRAMLRMLSENVRSSSRRFVDNVNGSANSH